MLGSSDANSALSYEFNGVLGLHNRIGMSKWTTRLTLLHHLPSFLFFKLNSHRDFYYFTRVRAFKKQKFSKNPRRNKHEEQLKLCKKLKVIVCASWDLSIQIATLFIEMKWDGMERDRGRNHATEFFIIRIISSIFGISAI